MEKLNLNMFLNREELETLMIKNLTYFEENKNNLLTKRGFYIYGSPGTGKTHFAQNILKKMDYDVIKFDAGDIRNKSIVDLITKHNMSDKNVLSLLQRKQKKIAIIMDEIDGMNSGDKGGINSLTKLIRPKKTMKQLGQSKQFKQISFLFYYMIAFINTPCLKLSHMVTQRSPGQNF